MGTEEEGRVAPDVSVFIIDDDPGVRSALSMVIEAHGLTAHGFASAEAFLDAYAPSGNDFLVVDLHLAGMNGAALLEELRARGFNVPTVLMTGRPDDALASRAMTAGVAAVLTKPFKSAELLRIVECTMSGRTGRG